MIIASLIANIGFSDEMPPEVKRLKSLRDKKVAEQLKDIDVAYYRELEKLKKQYAANGNYKAIVYIENMQVAAADAEKKAEDISAEKINIDQQAEVKCNTPFVRFRDGSNLYENKDDTYGDVDARFKGFDIMLRESGNTNPVNFEVEKEGYIYIVSGGASKHYLTENEWEEMGKVCTTFGVGNRAITLIGYQKKLAKGEYSMPTLGRYGVRLLQKRSN